MISPELLQNLSQSFLNFVARLVPNKLPVSAAALDSDLLNTSDASGLYFYNSATNIPETLDPEETFRPYLVTRVVDGTTITLKAQSLHNGNSLYSNSTADGVTWVGWTITSGDLYSISSINGIIEATKL
jgi:hypothetical protein